MKESLASQGLMGEGLHKIEIEKSDNSRITRVD
jgi:hypothetical protein